MTLRALCWTTLLITIIASISSGCQTGAAEPTVDSNPKVEAVPEPPPKPQFREFAFAAQAFRTPVIMYHDVMKARTPDTVWFDVTESELEEQMQWIQDNGITPISLQDLYDSLVHGKQIPERSIVLTFDDNHQGFYDIAWPILKRYNYPAAMFVHTGFVGDTTRERHKMSWDTLRELVKDPLFTVAPHTVNHPDDMTKLSKEQQRKEIRDSIDAIERELGVRSPFFAYPVGKNDAVTREIAKEEGILMAFTIDNGPAQESPGILQIHRYVHTRLKKSWEDRDKAAAGAPAMIVRQRWVDGPIRYEENEIEGVKLLTIVGGKPQSLNSSTRVGVLDFVKRLNAVGGINGSFFNMASLKGRDNKMVGPCKTSDMPMVVSDNERWRWPKIRNRPLVIWGREHYAILPFHPESMNSDEAIRAFMPDMTDVFLGGAWLIAGGIARPREEMNTFASSDIQDPRRRAFFGFMSDGSVVLGASRNSVTSAKLAEAAALFGVVDAVLLDSGFSTSLVFDGEIKATGHSTLDRPSRPVPHAIVVTGAKAEPDPALETPITPADHSEDGY